MHIKVTAVCRIEAVSILSIPIEFLLTKFLNVNFWLKRNDTKWIKTIDRLHWLKSVLVYFLLEVFLLHFTKFKVFRMSHSNFVSWNFQWNGVHELIARIIWASMITFDSSCCLKMPNRICIHSHIAKKHCNAYQYYLQENWNKNINEGIASWGEKNR